VEQGRGCRAEAEDNASETDEPICVQGQSETGSAVNDSMVSVGRGAIYRWRVRWEKGRGK